MKQRLLLVLLALFTSIGWMKADITVTVSKGSSGTLSWTKSTNTGAIDVSLTINGEATAVSGTSISVANYVKDKAATFVLDGSVSSFTVNGAKVERTFTVDGHTTLTSLTINGADGSKLTSVNLDQRDNAKLSLLKINNCGLESLPNYLSANLADGATVDLQNNKLTKLNGSNGTGALVVDKGYTYKFGGNQIHEWPDMENAKATIEYGSQSSLEVKRTASAANEWFNIWNGSNTGVTNLYQNLYHEGKAISADNLNFAWRKGTSGNFSSNLIEKSETYAGEFQFYNGKEYLDGTYQCEISPKSGVKAPTYVVTVDVKPAKFTLEYSADPADGNVFTVNFVKVESGSSTEITTGGNVYKGDRLVFTAKPNTSKGYAFSKFEVTGLQEDSKEKGIFTVVGNGKESKLTAKAIFTKNTYKITLDPSTENGTYEILNDTDNKEVLNGNSLAYGTTLTIKATPKEGYTPRVSVTVDGNTRELTKSTSPDEKGAYTFKDGTNNFEVKKATTIKIWFEQSSYSLKVQFLTGYSLKVNTGAQYNTIGTSEDAKGYYTNNSTELPHIAAGTIVTLEMTKGDDATEDIKKVLLNGKEVGTASKIQFTMPANEAIVTFETTKKATLSKDNFKVKAVDQTYVYDGNAHAFEYQTIPSGLSNIKVSYSRRATQNYTIKFTETVPTEVGDYLVRIVRPADASYNAFSSRDESTGEAVNGMTYKVTITQATPTITTIPTVTITNDGDFSIQNGVAQVGGKNVSGEWTVVNESDKAVTKSYLTESGVVTVAFLPEDDMNLAGSKDDDGKVSNAATVQVPVKVDGKDVATVEVKASDLPAGVTVTFWNGNMEIKNLKAVPVGTKLTVKVNCAAGITKAEIKENKAGATTLNYSSTTPDDGKVEHTFTSGITDGLDITVVVEGKATIITPKIKKPEAVQYDYDGNIHNVGETITGDKNNGLFTADHFDFENATDINDADEAELKKAMVISYKDANGKTVVAPVNAGEYTVVVSIPEVTTDNATYAAVTQEFDKLYIINKKEYTVDDITWPTDAVVGIGKTAKNAQFIGGSAPIEGTFHFIEEDKIGVPETGAEYEVKFVPADATNYAEVLSTNLAKIVVTDQRTLFISDVANGTIKVTDQNNNELKNGQTLNSGITSIKVTATPNSGYVLGTLTVNNTSISNGGSYTLGSDNVVVSATFVKQYTITLGSAPKGVKIATKPSSNVVVAGGSYTFTLNHVSGDKPTVTGASNISVSTSGSTTTVKVTNIQANATLAIALANPTAIKITTKPTLSKAGKPMGTIRVTGVNSSNECYYGDKITVTATANAGVEFSGWEDLTSTENPYEFEATNATYTFQAKYHGVLTGIESVDELNYYGGDGYIFVNCPAQGTLTIISMNGRAQKMSVSGQTRVTVPAGVYGIVLTSGSEVVRDKVVVR